MLAHVLFPSCSRQYYPRPAAASRFRRRGQGGGGRGGGEGERGDLLQLGPLFETKEMLESASMVIVPPGVATEEHARMVTHQLLSNPALISYFTEYCRACPSNPHSEKTGRPEKALYAILSQ